LLPARELREKGQRWGKQGVCPNVLESKREWSKEWQLLQRAVFVIDRAGRVVYAEYVADQMHEPDYPAAMEAACNLS
jgi:peroxiredoxin